MKRELGPAGRDLGAELVHHGLGADLLDGVEDGVGDLGQRLVPGDALPAPLAALTDAAQRVLEPVRGLHLQAPGQTLLADHRIHVGDAGLDLLAHARGLLPHHLAILHQHVDRAVAGDAVDAVGPEVRLVPLLLDPLALALFGRVGLAGVAHRPSSFGSAHDGGLLAEGTEERLPLVDDQGVEQLGALSRARSLHLPPQRRQHLVHTRSEQRLQVLRWDPHGLGVDRPILPQPVGRERAARRTRWARSRTPRAAEAPPSIHRPADGRDPSRRPRIPTNTRRPGQFRAQAGATPCSSLGKQRLQCCATLRT